MTRRSGELRTVLLRTSHFSLLTFSFVLLTSHFSLLTSAVPAAAPFFTARSQPAEYSGPGRDEPPPTDLKEIRLGWFGPTDPNHPTAGGMWCAATMAVDEANQAGGYNGLPFRLAATWSENPWGTGVKGVTDLVYRQGVWALIGAPDGPSAHLVEQVVAKARLTFVNPISTDKTTNLVNVPWIFSCAPGDHLQMPILAKAIVKQAGNQGFALLSCTDHDSRLRTTELLAALKELAEPVRGCAGTGATGSLPASAMTTHPSKHGRASRPWHPKRHLEFKPASRDFAAQIQAIREAQPAAIVVIAGPDDSAAIIKALRAQGIDLPIFGGPTMGHTRFRQAAGPNAEGVTFPLLWHPSTAGKRSERFARRYRDRFAAAPDYTAAYTYDATNLLVAAVRQAGLNRARIRDAVRTLSPWQGVTGKITWDPAGASQARVGLGTIRRGQVGPVNRSD